MGDTMGGIIRLVDTRPRVCDNLIVGRLCAWHSALQAGNKLDGGQHGNR